MGHGRIFDGSRPGIIEIDYVLLVEILTENVGSFSATNVVIRFLSWLPVRNYCDVEIFTKLTTLCTICRYWRHFEADRWLLLPS